MGGNGLALAVRVRREIDRLGVLCQLLQLGEDFFLAGNDDIFGLEVGVRINAQLALRQILHVPERRFHVIATTKILLDGLGFAR